MVEQLALESRNCLLGLFILYHAGVSKQQFKHADLRDSFCVELQRFPYALLLAQHTCLCVDSVNVLLRTLCPVLNLHKLLFAFISLR